MNDAVEIKPELVRKHADFVAEIADRAQKARDASEHIRLGGEAYGILCQAIPALMAPTHDEFNTKLDELKTALVDTSEMVRNASNDIEGMDIDNSIDLDEAGPQ